MSCAPDVAVKMCGNTNRADLELLAQHGVDYAGIIVGVPSSARNVPPEQAAALFSASPVPAVLVVVNPPLSDLLSWLDAWRPAAIQLHGEESAELVRTLTASRAYEVWKTLHLPPADEAAQDAVATALERAEQYRGAGVARFLLDTATGGRLGGTGQVSDWGTAREVVGELPLPVLLAGGLHPGNVAEALHTVRPAGVDVASGAEARKGVKDPRRVAAFMAAVRAACD